MRIPTYTHPRTSPCRTQVGLVIGLVVGFSLLAGILVGALVMSRYFSKKRWQEMVGGSKVCNSMKAVQNNLSMAVRYMEIIEMAISRVELQ